MLKPIRTYRSRMECNSCKGVIFRKNTKVYIRLIKDTNRVSRGDFVICVKCKEREDIKKYHQKLTGN